MPSIQQPRYVEVGRVCLVNFGPTRGKLCTIVNIVDQKRVLVDGPQAKTGIARQIMPLARLTLTSVKINIPRNLRSANLTKKFTEANADAEFGKTAWAQRIAIKAKRGAMSDFERFKVMVAKKTRTKAVNTIANKKMKANKK
mmetsp:Transcript_15310/g.36141  ORF Transcript_15310/g.36141 Transcript_15310/m.36141 type:complete len:142 (-) Transcript_15310:46-471(-)|eukprot:CAMPEP_0114541654 /NCGR_PEP_ID=MMETSP0114-20121206/1418_1 /TAXON_ID=31324 /ORGANISM="Goniomonas sp, Strain m" /LENGTH=141 /DNA_ID=CAMNT_0001725901 /DNA_START=46 /DNA_END=471 /DNA_ORIENTATION=+